MRPRRLGEDRGKGAAVAIGVLTLSLVAVGCAFPSQTESPPVAVRVIGTLALPLSGSSQAATAILISARNGGLAPRINVTAVDAREGSTNDTSPIFASVNLSAPFVDPSVTTPALTIANGTTKVFAALFTSVGRVSALVLHVRCCEGPGGSGPRETLVVVPTPGLTLAARPNAACALDAHANVTDGNFTRWVLLRPGDRLLQPFTVGQAFLCGISVGNELAPDFANRTLVLNRSVAAEPNGSAIAEGNLLGSSTFASVPAWDVERPIAPGLALYLNLRLGAGSPEWQVFLSNETGPQAVLVNSSGWHRLSSPVVFEARTRGPLVLETADTAWRNG